MKLAKSPKVSYGRRGRERRGLQEDTHRSVVKGHMKVIIRRAPGLLALNIRHEPLRYSKQIKA